MKRWLLIVVLAGLAAAAWWILRMRDSLDSSQFQPVRVNRSSIVRKAVAVGRIEVEQEISINSHTGGILTRLFVRQGQKVETGALLAEVRPVATEQVILAAERNLEQAIKEEENANEYFQRKHLASDVTQLFLGDRNLQRMKENAQLNRQQAEERLELLKKGTAKINNRIVDFIVRAPLAGHVLEIKQREGTPVVPASSYGLGTVFMTLADMSRLLFRGTADEIDVGRMREGMSAQIRIGALPGAEVRGQLVEIALKGQERNNAMVFDVLISLEATPVAFLRSGYSAVAEIEIDRRHNVLTLPERVIEFRGSQAFVQVSNGRGEILTKEIETGLSDGFTVEIVGGLAEGDEVLERLPKRL